LKEAAGRVRGEAFELVLDQPRYWKHNRIAWAGASSVPPALSSLSDALRAELSGCGFEFDAKPFVAHVTLVRDARTPKELPVLAPVRWQVAGFALVQSSGGRYNVLESWPLVGSH
jgi:2'-5' RNA ligase